MKKLYLIFLALFVLTIAADIFAQNEVVVTIEDAKRNYLIKDLPEAVKSLEHALDLLNKELIMQLERLFPDPMNGWRCETPSSQIVKDAYNIFLNSQKKYFKQGGGASVDVKFETNAARIVQLKMIFVNPSKVSQVGNNAKISKINEYRSVERYDPLDKFGEIIFLPASSLLVTIRGYDVKNTDDIRKYAENIKWNEVEKLFP